MPSVLGISGRDRDAAAAVSVDGRVVSAVSEESFARVVSIGYNQRGGFPTAAVGACLQAAGLEPEELDHVVVVDDGGARPSPALNGRLRGIPVREIAAARADAVNASMVSDDAGVVLVCGPDIASMTSFQRNGTGLGSRTEVPGADGMLRAARVLATMLGLEANDPLAAIDRLSLGAEPVFKDDFAAALHWNGAGKIEADVDALAEIAAKVSGDHAPNLPDAASLNARLQDVRKRIAASFTSQLAAVVGAAAMHLSSDCNDTPIVAGGGLFANPRFNTELRTILRDDLAIAQVPEAAGRAVGAAASGPDGHGGGVLALGPSFSDEDIKRVLDNCRLDYVYEPDWARLMTRVSRMLAQGKVVAWFQGAMAFGPRALGTRSVLCNPSSRYARQNVNEYLRRLPVDEPLPIAFAGSAADAVLVRPATRAVVLDAEVRQDWRPRLAGALDWRQCVRVHGAAGTFEPRLQELLELHLASTGTPGLIETNLAGPEEPVACTPRDAVRITYSSAVDALVIGRFLLMKDYWLLRNQD